MKNLFFTIIFVLSATLIFSQEVNKIIELEEIEIYADFAAINNYLNGKNINIEDYKYYKDLDQTMYNYLPKNVIMFEKYALLQMGLFVDKNGKIRQTGYTIKGLNTTLDELKAFILDYAVSNDIRLY